MSDLLGYIYLNENHNEESKNDLKDGDVDLA